MGRATSARLFGISLATLLSVLLVPAAFVVLAEHYFGRLFLLIEYRQWIASPHFVNLLDVFAPNTLANPTVMSLSMGRTFSLFGVEAISHVCGSAAGCHDAFQISLLAVSAVLLGATLASLFPETPRFFIAGTLIFLLAATPIFDALAWQATTHDKFALLYTALATLIVARIRLEDNRFAATAAMNVVLLLVVIAAYNSKQAAFALLPSLVILLASRFAAADGRPTKTSVLRSLGKSLIRLALPTAYAVFHLCIVYVSMVEYPEQYLRLVVGDISVNAFHDFIYLFNLMPIAESFNLFPFAGDDARRVFVAALIAIIVIVGALVGRFAPLRLRFFAGWAALSFAMAIVIPLRTAAGSPFYLVVPLYYVSIVVFTLLAALWSTLSSPSAQRAMSAAVAIFLCADLVSAFGVLGSFRPMIRMSANFTSPLPRVARLLDRAPLHLNIFYPASELRAYMFLGPPGNPWLAPYFSDRARSFEALVAFDRSITITSYTTTPAPQPTPGQLFLVYGEHLNVLDIVSPRLTSSTTLGTATGLRLNP